MPDLASRSIPPVWNVVQAFIAMIPQRLLGRQPMIKRLAILMSALQIHLIRSILNILMSRGEPWTGSHLQNVRGWTHLTFLSGSFRSEWIGK